MILFLDLFVYIFVIQFILCHKIRLFSVMFDKIFNIVRVYLGFSINIPNRSMLSLFVFFIVLINLFGGYLFYSFNFFSNVWFTFFFAFTL